MKPDLFFKLSAPIYFIAVIWSLSASQMGCSAGTIQESSCAFGYHALKINNRFIDQEIFLEERNRFFMRWHTNADMMHKGEEERTDLLLDDIITRVVLEDFLQNRSGITITTQETENYINQYIRPKFPSPEDFASFLHDKEYKNEADLRKNIELHLLKRTCFAKLAKEAGLIIPQEEVDSLYRKHVDENRYAVTRQIIIKDADSVKALQLVGELYHQCENGTDFSTLATQYSSDEPARSAGDLHPIHTRADFDSAAAEKIFSAQPGEVLPPMKTGQGYMLVKVERFICSYHPQAEFIDMLLLERFGESELFRKWITELKSKSSISIVDPSMKAFRLFRSGRYDQAGALYERLFRKRHDDFNLKRAIDSFEKAGDPKKVIRLAQTGMQINPENFMYPLIKAEYLYRQGQTNDALALLHDVELRSKGNPYFADLLAKTRSKLGIVK